MTCRQVDDSWGRRGYLCKHIWVVFHICEEFLNKNVIQKQNKKDFFDDQKISQMRAEDMISQSHWKPCVY